jgi:hypothetical protein
MKPVPDEKLTYFGKHYRVYKAQGPARNYTCQMSCGKQAAHWATIHGTDGLNPMTGYMPLCRSCHTQYDDIPEKTRTAHKGKPKGPQTPEHIANAHTPEIIVRQVAGRTGLKRSAETRARMSAAQKKRWEIKKNAEEEEQF